VQPIKVGSPRPLGAAPTRQGVNFALFSRHATRVELCLFDADGAERARYDLPGRSGDVWHGLVPSRRAGAGTRYAFRVHGVNDPGTGARFDAGIELLDPYGRAVSTEPPLRSLIVDTAFDWQDDRPPAIPWRDSVIYELHVKGYTQLHPLVAAEHRGKYLGLASEPVIAHLKSLGVTAVQLLPCQAFLSESFLTARGLSNYWGYNPIAWFAPANEYAVEDAVREFKTMVQALHRAHLEVILDVVFNHTAEGGESGPVLCFKGIDNEAYYRLTADKRGYENLTGCGNTLNCEHPAVRALIVDCLRYWVEEMHVDGFRFDLATVLGREAGGFNESSPFFSALRAEPSLAYVKLIAEPWDIGLGGYQLGRFPAGWSEWNDRYRDTVRSFWRQDGGRIGEFAERLAGSSDIFRHNGRKPTASVNFVTAHDGFTLNDLVSYDQPHNEANGENGQDGTRHNLSRNWGHEGPSVELVELRKRLMRNILATLLLSQGVPMLTAGDEFARTQQGNNNAYCQDNAISWVDWSLLAANADLVDFVRLVASLRRSHVEFRRETFLKGAASRVTVKDVTWLHARGAEMTQDDWRDGNLRTLGIWYGKRSNWAARLLLLLNAADSVQTFALPAPPADSPWRRRFDTASKTTEVLVLEDDVVFPLAPSSAVFLEC
jgi:isoamylase